MRKCKCGKMTIAAPKARELERVIQESRLRLGGEVNFLNVRFSQFESPFEERLAVYAARKTDSVFRVLEESGVDEFKGR